MDDNTATFSAKAEDRAYLAEPAQPVLEGKVPRVRADGSRVVKGVRYFAPVLPKGQVQILGIAVAPTPEEASGLLEASHGVQMEVKPRLLKGPLGVLIPDSMNRFGNLFSDHFAYATLIPWLLPKNRRNKPKKEEVEWSVEIIHDLIAETKPRCIIAFGKVVFDQLVDFKISADDARGGWFSYRDTGIPIYLADPVVTLITQPWMVDTLITDFREVDMLMERRWGNPPPEIPLEYAEIRTMAELESLVRFWEANDLKLFSVDCEWGGTQYIDGRLRSIQFCWAPGKAAYLNFFDEHGDLYLGRDVMESSIECEIHPNQRAGPGDEYTDYQAVGKILGSWLNRPDVKYMGHHFSADSVWMEHWLGLDVLGKCVFDLEFAAQTCNEYAKLGLEVMAMRYTSFGRYDFPLVMWKRENKLGEDDGYAKIPDSILVEYALKDVDCVMRCYQPVMEDLHRQELTGYYNNYVLPFVTDVFHTFITAGLPVDLELFHLTRAFFNWAYRALLEDLRDMLESQANDVVADKTGIPLPVVKRLAAERDAGNAESAAAALKAMNPDIPEYLVRHWEGIRNFNIRSHQDMRRWLFDVLELTPVKTTKNADNGMPQMTWEKVLELPEKLRATLSPAVDKETLEILLERDPTGSIARLLAVSNVGNQCKGFLKEGELDADGELVKENGLAKFITTAGKIAPNFSLTETGRPRGWKPNTLNLSKYHNKGVVAGLIRVLENKNNDPRFVLPKEFETLFGSEEERKGVAAKDLVKLRLPSVRSTIAAPPGWCGVESDYKTAEIRGQAFIPGDVELINLMVGKDTDFGLSKGRRIRLSYPQDAGIAPENQKPEYVMAWCAEGKAPVPVSEEELDRDAEGNLLHPPYDLHWSLAELSNATPREGLVERDRDCAKVGNFCIAEGELVRTKERGEIPIQDVLASDLVWDGGEWVLHDGVVKQGIQEVHFYQGLWATLGHEVWIRSAHDGEPEKVSLHAAMLSEADLVSGYDSERELLRPETPCPRMCMTYDLLNAGPRHRFTCSGVLVSNSGAYGVVGPTLERRIEAQTGIKPKPGTGEDLLMALKKRQPVSVAFLEDVAEWPKRGTEMRAASGRLRHFPVHSRELKGMPWRVRNSYLRAMGNEARNFLFQESVAATLSRACQSLNAWFRKMGMKARTNIGLYDAILTFCPLEERHVVAEAHQVFMTDVNCWRYHGRWFNYPIDTDFVYRWSWKPTEEEKKMLCDPSWSAMEEGRFNNLIASLSEIKKDFHAAQPWIKPRLNVV